ncbi:MAG: hypothetical protein JW956_12055 [Calditrichaceae bacterium]|nr:hypothetical protein [Calditrichaceae bacterium]
MTLWNNIKKGLMEGIHTATDKTSEYTKIGRIKIDILGVKKEIEEKLLELGGRLYDKIVEKDQYDIQNDKYIMQLIEQVKELENELKKYSQELNRIKIDDGIDLD